MRTRLEMIARVLRRPWFDYVLAAALLAAGEIELLASKHLRGPVVLNVLVMAVILGAVAWRRRMPLAFAAVIMSLSVLFTATLTNITSIVVPIYVLFVPAYTVAAYAPRQRALVGLVICIAGPLAINAVTNHSGASDYVFTGGLSGAAWAAGRAMRTHRRLAEELTRKAYRIAAEREARERLAVADERTRIARELHAVVANSITAMVVQTAAADRLLDANPSAADEAMKAIEETGRQALAEMRRILGVLRHSEDTPELSPQPGVGQIHALVDRAREQRRRVELHVEGEPGPLPASVDLGVYRILEDALATAGQRGPELMEVFVHFGEHEVELVVTSESDGAASWPTLAMRERLGLCGGELAVEPVNGVGHRLLARLPRAFDEVFA